LLYADLYGLDVVVLRYAAVLGGSLETPTSVPGRLLARLVEGGRRSETVTLDDPYLAWGGMEEFVDARDCARANLHALDAAAPVKRVYNVATGTAVTLRAFVDSVRRVHPALRVALAPEPVTGFAGFPHRRPAPSDVASARADLGFACAHDLEDTIRHWSGAP
jgi:UDP-glucose 4-epimerase